MSSTIDEQLRKRRLKHLKKKQRHSSNAPIHIDSNDDDNEDIKMQNDNDESTDSDTNDYEISYEPQLQTLETKIKEQERKCNHLYNKLKSETKKLSKYQSEYEHLKAMKNQQNNTHNHNNHNNDNSNNNDYVIPPELIEEDQEQRQRMERQMKQQQDHDHEIAMQLQRQFQREERRQQQRQQQLPPHAAAYNQRRPPIPNRHRSFSSSSMSSSMEADNDNHDDFAMHIQAHHDRVRRLIGSREPYLGMFGSSPFSSSIRPSSFDQSAINEISRHRMRTAHLFRNFDDEFDNMSYEQLNSLFPNVPRGADEETIQRLPTDTFEEKQQPQSNNNNNKRRKKKKNDDDDENSKCCICLEKFQNGEEIRRLPCMHIFHKHEIDKWLRTNKVCPICRIDVETSSH